MPRPLPSWFRRPETRTWLALSAGVLWALAFPRFEIHHAAWIAPGLLLLAGFGVTAPRAAMLGYLAGLAHHLVALSWLLNIPFAFGNVAAWLSLSAYCALYPAAWLWLAARTWQWLTIPPQARPANELSKTRTDPFGLVPGIMRGPAWESLASLLSATWARRQIWLLVAAVSWTGLEFLRGWFLSGFPWNFLGASQYQLVPLIQLAAITGVHGVSFMIVWVSVSLGVGVMMVLARPHARFAWKNEIAPAIFTLVVLVAWGFGVATQPALPSRGTLKAALVQPSIPQTLIFDLAESTNRFRQLLELSRQALAAKPDLLIWPEASMPTLDRTSFEQLQNLLREHQVPLILGADDAAAVNDARGEHYVWFNAALHLDSGGQFQTSYRKQRLVMFGEYTPFARQLPFLNRLLPAGEGFGSGTGPVTFRIEPIGANISVNICFEDNFADLVRAQVDTTTDFVLNLTNNGWFGESAAQWQHAANAVFRAIENGVPLVRCTNNGLTCWIDEHGRIRETFRDVEGSVYGAGFAVFAIPLQEIHSSRTMTAYHRHGDWFGWSCLATSLAMGGLTYARRRSTVTP